MTDLFPQPDSPKPEDFALGATLPGGLIKEVSSYAAKRGWTLAEFLALANDPDEGINICRVEASEPVRVE